MQRLFSIEWDEKNAVEGWKDSWRGRGLFQGLGKIKRKPRLGQPVIHTWPEYEPAIAMLVWALDHAKNVIRTRREN
jgi:hypothetical protein